MLNVIHRFTMICDFQQIQGGQRIRFSIINRLASLSRVRETDEVNLLEKTEFSKSDDARDKVRRL
jgi:hypothetical protein